ncbi:response regulator [Geothrix sp. 21YS21S-4]|uniref:response regulator n=1 Tax=Geothrix sp. 21YS21S-4 TaxID=3068889 RepID=UPI0027BA9379|nr:response regulator [Geothrix sp. 21YS21S-4]
MNPQGILLVEDNPQDELLTLRSLKRVNLANAVEVVRDGQDALDYLFHQGSYGAGPVLPLPAVVLLDLGLPRVGGLDVLKRIRADARTRHLPVVILTSSPEEQDRLRSYLGGANSFVRKPIDFTEFAETVARLGVYWMAVNQAPLQEAL